MTHTGFKIVRVKDGKRISVFMRGKEAHTYRKGRWTKPKRGYGPLCVLDHEWFARDYCLRGGEEVWECEFKISPARSVWTPESEKASLSTLMTGTVLASCVKLTKLFWRL